MRAIVTWSGGALAQSPPGRYAVCMASDPSPSPAASSPPPQADRADRAGMTPQQLAEAKHYGRLELACGLADKLLDLVYLAAVAILLARPLDAWLQSISCKRQ